MKTASVPFSQVVAYDRLDTTFNIFVHDNRERILALEEKYSQPETLVAKLIALPMIAKQSVVDLLPGQSTAPDQTSLDRFIRKHPYVAGVMIQLHLEATQDELSLQVSGIQALVTTLKDCDL